MNRQAKPMSRCRSAEQVEHRGLHRDVQRAGRLVGHQQRRGRGHQRPGDADPLALAAGQLVRVAAGDLGPQPDPAELLGHPACTSRRESRPGAAAAVRPTMSADEHPRVERAGRVLEDDGDVAAVRAHLPAGQVR